VILLDTHVLIWLAEDSPHLGRRAVRLADVALQRDQVVVSVISFWEIAMLAEERRLRLDVTPAAMRRRSLEQGIHEVELSGSIAIAAAQLHALHGDPAGQMIIATALAIGAEMLTADDRILGWSGSLKLHDARR
jgi:PIN domain nuclease of toxin-antitoxin system